MNPTHDNEVLPAPGASERKVPGAQPTEPNQVSHLHVLQRDLDEVVFYPPHSPRKESSDYGAIHQQLVHEEDRPCVVCGVRASTLKDPRANRFSAGAIETHHAVIEWSLTQAVDLARFNAQVVARLRVQQPNAALYRRDFTRREMEAWIDHHPDNLWVLCDVHHRHRGVGIHAISGPIWGAQTLLCERYELGSQETLKAMRKLLGT